MPLKPSDIQKKLPGGGKKNCKECGFPTCLAFAMKLVSGGVALEKCPYLDPEVKEWIVDAITPPIKLVSVGAGERILTVGEEEVVYRHEKTFFRPPGLAVLISDAQDDQAIKARLKKLNEYEFRWVTFNLRADLVVLKHESGSKERYLSVVTRVAQEKLPMVLMCEDLGVLFAARDLIADQKPLLYPITNANLEEALPGLKEKAVPVAVRGQGLEEVVSVTTKLKAAGISDIMIDTSPRNLKEALRDYTLIRRAALKHTFRPLGYPIISFLPLKAEDAAEEALLASALVIKYASVIVLNDLHRETLFPLLVHRLNIYTDPRVPLAVEEKVYEIGEPNEESPVFLTTNFALTYFAVANGVEACKIPGYLGVKGTDGLCVLAAWSTGKFVGETVGPFIKNSGLEGKLKKKRLIIPGLAARIKGEIEDELPGWEVIVGPKEAEELPAFMSKLIAGW
ncbi:acetyl-CoA decarbonylase/synthase complex subunit gamma [Candidatus Desulforudis audaxviator]|uniref:CO dehydrogenase/acetyl-CoA synthase delta subunit n=1 Tax=Desulforudis audaxviator (strain MP104C) TaxID=477974 RepID=B1I1F5_DESAP|nr:acetyl-CoA decarbonylase/synthase complex subunit gamma [Candidatus Desulforudis audaxviator]ACA58680.1 CO dehydrogenase/acetyl-CoA synthase delta subunit [Candidatus Desulforudis audaxviator MP104C]AZK58680.1 CO dehydrogenase/acetyl-CoA synthase gamma subunit (corrinoid Fe-S protein) [Candidatus Desulforudis audaxviator]